jgi:hypothetical protein
MRRKTVYIKAELIGTNFLGQKRIKLMARGAEGLCFYTDEKSILTEEDLRARFGGERKEADA